MTTENRPLAVGLGEVLWDVFPDGKRLGGAPANFAWHAAQQGCRACVVSAVGDDALGREIESALAGKNLPAVLPRLPQPTGTVRIALDESGSAAYRFAENCAWDNLPFSPEAERVARSADAVCFGSLAQRGARSREAIARFLDCVPAGALRVFDVNLRQNFFTDEILRGSLARCSILKLNEDEAPVVAALLGADARCSRETLFAALFENFPALEIVVETLGKAGSVVATRGGVRSEVPADPRVRVVDTVGAGDSFTACFVACLLFGKTPEVAHRRSAATADFVCSRAGAMPEIPRELRCLAD